MNSFDDEVLFTCRGGAIQFFGTKRHHDKWLKVTEDYKIKGCFAMTELGHGSNVRRQCFSLTGIILGAFSCPLFIVQLLYVFEFVAVSGQRD